MPERSEHVSDARQTERGEPARPAAPALSAAAPEALFGLAGEAATLADPRYGPAVNDARKARVAAAIQRGAGNAALQRMLGNPSGSLGPGRGLLQRKRAMTTTTDPAEQAADRAADRALGGADRGALGQHLSPVAGNAGLPAIADDAVNLGDGRPLEPAVRTDMEGRFGVPFADVRVHTDATAATTARSLGAQAFTSGHQIGFAAGAYQPDLGNGRRLLAHELAHVVQQRGDISTVARQPNGNQPLAVRARETLLPPVVNQELRNGMAAADDSGFGAALAAAAVKALGTESTPEENDEVTRRAQADGALTRPAGETILRLTGALRAIAALHAANGQPGMPGVPQSYGLEYLLRVMTNDIASHLANGLSSVGGTTAFDIGAAGRVEQDLDQAVAAATDSKSLLNLELEGTVDAVLRLRAQFETTTEQAQRATIGQQLGEASRRAILLNQTIENMQKGGAGADTALDKSVTAAAGKIAQIRQSAAKEDTTKQAFTAAGGNEAALLTAQPITLANPAFPEQFGNQPQPGATIKPDEALPQTTDSATNSMMNDLNRRVKNQQADVDRLKNQVIPAAPKYDIPEFTAIFKRWFAFFSLHQEEQDPIIKMWKENLPTIYNLAGNDALSGPSKASGIAGRSLLTNIAAEQLERQMGQSSASSDFSGQLKANAPKRVQGDVTGSASDPNFRYANLYNDPRRTHPPTASGEASSREALAANQQAATAARFSAVAALPPDQQPAAAAQAGLTPANGPAAPIVGMKNVQAKEGWTYLVNVTQPGDDSKLVAREQKTLPPEVVAYLLARQQQTATLTQPHVPTVNGQPAGDASMRGDAPPGPGITATPGTPAGVEGGQANAVAKYTQGATNPAPSAAAQNLNKTLTDAKQGAGIRNDTNAQTQAEQITRQLIGDLERYFDGFFKARSGAEYHIGAVLVAANIQYGIGSKILALLTPAHIAKAVATAMGIGLATATLEAMGPLGKLAATALQKLLATQGVSNLAAAIGIADFFRSAGQADSLVRTRVWALMSQNIIDDLTQLFDTLVGALPAAGAGAGARHVIDRVTRSRPGTTHELVVTCRPMMQNPEARKALLDGVEAHVKELEAGGAKAGDPEFDQVVAFRDELRTGRPQGPESGKALIGTQEETDATKHFAAGRTRTAAEKAALLKALPPDLAGRTPIVENPTLSGSTVLVVYRHGELRIEVGPGAEPRHIEAHVDTARQLLRYEGAIGTVRRLMDNIKTFLGLTPGFGTEGFEARLEVQKLRAIEKDLDLRLKTIDERTQRLSENPELANNAGEREAIQKELDAIRQQIDEHQKNVESLAPGRGFVAALAPATHSAFPGLHAELTKIEATLAGRPDEARLFGMVDDIANLQANQKKVLGFEDWVQDSKNRAADDLARVIGELGEARRLAASIAGDPDKIVRIGQDSKTKTASFDNTVEQKGPGGATAPGSTTLVRHVEVFTEAEPQITKERDFFKGIAHGASAMGPRLPTWPAGLPPGSREATVRVNWSATDVVVPQGKNEKVMRPDGSYEIRPAGAPSGTPAFRNGHLADDLLRFLNGSHIGIDGGGRVPFLHVVTITDMDGKVIFRFDNSGGDTGTPSWTRTI